MGVAFIFVLVYIAIGWFVTSLVVKDDLYKIDKLPMLTQLCVMISAGILWLPTLVAGFIYRIICDIINIR